jgi:hypothetical protein
LKALPGEFETLSGNRYRTVILPAPLVISAAMLARLRAFAVGGGKVVFIGATPRWIAARTFRDAREATAREFAWARIVNATLPSTPTPPAEAPTAPPGPQEIPPELLAAVSAAVVAPTVQLDRADTALRVMKRAWADADVYLFFNESAYPCRHAVTLMSRRRNVESWNVQKGTVERKEAAFTGGHPLVRLDLGPYAAELIVVQ